MTKPSLPPIASWSNWKRIKTMSQSKKAVKIEEGKIQFPERNYLTGNLTACK